MTPSSSGPTPLNPRGRGVEPTPDQAPEEPSAAHQGRSESAISSEAQAVRTLASAHRVAGEIENEARRKASELTAQAELHAAEQEREARARAEAMMMESRARAEAMVTESQARSETMIAEARAERDRIWEQIRAGVSRATRQVGDLLRIREDLRLDLREVMRDSNSAIARLEEGGSEPGPIPAPPPRSLPPAADPTAGGSGAPIAGRASEVRSSPLSPKTPAPPVPPRQPAEQTAGETGGAPLASLRIGPFESFLAVMRFERTLAGLPGIDAVYVRRFSNGEVDVEVESLEDAESLATTLRAVEGVERVERTNGMVKVLMSTEPKPQE